MVYEALFNVNRKWSPVVLVLIALRFTLQHDLFWKIVYFQWTFFKERQVIVTAIELGKDVKFPEETEVMQILGAKHTGIQI